MNLFIYNFISNALCQFWNANNILEKDSIPGGACDGFDYKGIGYVMRGGREIVNRSCKCLIIST